MQKWVLMNPFSSSNIFADFALILPHTKGNIIVKYISVQTVWAGMFSVINRHLKIIEILSLRLCSLNKKDTPITEINSMLVSTLVLKHSPTILLN